ncbi:MAG TPA: GTPase Era, partial [Clostridiales bacterium]|nr:GTPase Era [Clostridiales bacterium]
MTPKNPATCFVAIMGKSNVGKSTLLNNLMGEKIAAVSNKPQTTRTRITGVLTKENVQYVFLDTPGIHRARNRLGEEMNRMAVGALTDVNCTLL